MKKALKIILVYSAELLLGLLLWQLVRPYALANRADKSLIGGECLMPCYSVGAVAVVRVLRNDKKNDETPEA